MKPPAWWHMRNAFIWLLFWMAMPFAIASDLCGGIVDAIGNLCHWLDPSFPSAAETREERLRLLQRR